VETAREQYNIDEAVIGEMVQQSFDYAEEFTATFH